MVIHFCKHVVLRIGRMGLFTVSDKRVFWVCEYGLIVPLVAQACGTVGPRNIGGGGFLMLC